jgi:hypothetical protein
MDEKTVREAAQAHGDAVVRGDLKAAGGDLTREAVGAAQEVMGGLPQPVQHAECFEVAEQDGAFVAQIRYRGEDDERVVESRWEDRDGTPKIIDLRIV